MNNFNAIVEGKELEIVDVRYSMDFISEYATENENGDWVMTQEDYHNYINCVEFNDLPEAMRNFYEEKSKVTVYEYPESWGDCGEYMSQEDVYNIDGWEIWKTWHFESVERDGYSGTLQDYIDSEKEKLVAVEK